MDQNRKESQPENAEKIRYEQQLKDRKKAASEVNREFRKQELTEIKNVIRSEDILLLLYILKNSTDYDHALSISQVTDLLNRLIPSGDMDQELFSDRTIRRKLELFTIQENDMAEGIKNQLNKILPSLTGGSVEYRAADGIDKGINQTGAGTQKRFYFEPVLDESDMNLIYGALMSSRFLSESEKSYLLSRLTLIRPGYPSGSAGTEDGILPITEIDPLPKKPAASHSSNLPVNSSKLLRNVQTLYDAIAGELQVKVIYGIYDIADKGGRVDFHERHPGEPYILNPYAMFWNDGEYYLISTKDNEEQIMHFRVDRIMDVSYNSVTEDDGSVNTIKRAPIPDSLKPFYKKINGVRTFDGISYSGAYPAMKIYRKENKVDCRFECTNVTLQILIDYFGTDIHLEESRLKHSEEELTDQNGEPRRFLIATVRNVQWENAVDFCLGHSRYITLLEPSEMVDEIRKHLKTIRKKYKSGK